MRETSGITRLAGRLAYVSQQSWIFSGTVRDNIILGSHYEPEWFSEVLELCALTRDLELLEDGDLTEVGERGITLSGGQKQRISLARALYSRADIFLLDDPLSAVDSKVGQFIFKRVIKESLAEKTVLLVSHGLQYLRECDTVIYLEEGRMMESGQPEELLARPGGHLARLAEFDYKRDEQDTKQRIITREISRQVSRQVSRYEEEDVIHRTLGEEPVTLSGWSPLLRYLRECGHPLELAAIFILLLGFVLTRLLCPIFLQRWLDAGAALEEDRRQNNTAQDDFRGNINYNTDQWKYQLGYGMIILVMILTGFCKVRQVRILTNVHKVCAEFSCSHDTVERFSEDS